MGPCWWTNFIMLVHQLNQHKTSTNQHGNHADPCWFFQQGAKCKELRVASSLLRAKERIGGRMSSSPRSKMVNIVRLNRQNARLLYNDERVSIFPDNTTEVQPQLHLSSISTTSTKLRHLIDWQMLRG